MRNVLLLLATTIPFAPEHLGHKSTGGETENFFAGDMHEVLVYDRALSDVECRQVEAYLAAKWEVTAATGTGLPSPSKAASTGISHGPMLGAVSPTTAALWLRTREPREVRLALTSAATATQTATLHTDASTDNTAGALARVHRYPPKDLWPEEMLYSYGGAERNMFGEIDFHPAADMETAITFRSFSGANGVVQRFRLTPGDLGLAAQQVDGQGWAACPGLGRGKGVEAHSSATDGGCQADARSEARLAPEPRSAS